MTALLAFARMGATSRLPAIARKHRNAARGIGRNELFGSQLRRCLVLSEQTQNGPQFDYAQYRHHDGPGGSADAGDRPPSSASAAERPIALR
jgi:hypothetical protein